eukprot:7376122-Prymnesium_polylepis.2
MDAPAVCASEQPTKQAKNCEQVCVCMGDQEGSLVVVAQHEHKGTVMKPAFEVLVHERQNGDNDDRADKGSPGEFSRPSRANFLEGVEDSGERSPKRRCHSGSSAHAHPIAHAGWNPQRFKLVHSEYVEARQLDRHHGPNLHEGPLLPRWEAGDQHSRCAEDLGNEGLTLLQPGNVGAVQEGLQQRKAGPGRVRGPDDE